MILLIDQDDGARGLTRDLLATLGLVVLQAGDGAAGLKVLADPDAMVELVIIDPVLPDMAGAEALSALRQRHPTLPVLVLTGSGSVSAAVSAMQAGADDFLIKPVAPARLTMAVKKALSRDMPVGRLDRSGSGGAGRGATGDKASDAPDGAFDHLIAEAPATSRAIQVALKGAVSSIPILIEGESGVGKEVFARAIHAASDRRNGPFVPVNCGAIPENLVESILFGHEKGAFTGAVSKRIGKFEEAQGGVLFLDEIGELPLDAQVKLLRAIQEKEVDPVGGAGARRIDIRLVSATNRTLSLEVEAGRFREDLYYRISVYPLVLPPLRDRREDIAPLAEQLATKIAKAEGRPFAGFTPAAEMLLTNAAWPGNVRQMENMIHRALVLAVNEILDVVDFPHLTSAALRGSSVGIDASPFVDAEGHVRPLAEIEADVLAFAMTRYQGRLSEIARRLGIGRSTLYRRLNGDVA
ncbi:MAG: sigma-54-dependent transcriptional regulator [Pikeienuella sp.]